MMPGGRKRGEEGGGEGEGREAVFKDNLVTLVSQKEKYTNKIRVTTAVHTFNS